MGKIINQALEYLGIKEGTPEFRKLIDRYNDTVKPLPRGYKMTYSNAWCCAFVTLVFSDCGMLDVIGGGEVSCNNLIKIAQGMGIWIEDGSIRPQPEDLVLYDWQGTDGLADHIGIVYMVGERFNVIEGNYSDSVKIREISIGDKRIRGFIRPKYSDAKPTVTPPTVEKPTKTDKEVLEDVIAGLSEIINKLQTL